MHLLWFQVAVCAIAFVYCIYQTHRRLALKKRRQLCQRVAYLLWVSSERAGDRETSLAR